MIKQALILVKKMIFSSFLLYGYNIIAEPIGIYIPINVPTILIVVLFGYPSLFSLILIQVLIY